MKKNIYKLHFLLVLSFSISASVRERIQQFEKLSQDVSAAETQEVSDLKEERKLQAEEIKALQKKASEQKEKKADLLKKINEYKKEIEEEKKQQEACFNEIQKIKEELVKLDEQWKKKQEEEQQRQEVQRLKILEEEQKEEEIRQAQEKEDLKIPVAHMFIMYDNTAALDDENHSMGRNIALPKEITKLFEQDVTPILFNGAIAEVILYFINNPDDSKFNSEGLTIIRNALKDFDENKWELYALYSASQPFVLFIPKDYLNNHPQTGLNLEKLERFEKKDITSVRDNLKSAIATPSQELKPISSAILSIFKSYDEKNPLVWNIVLSGHGLTSIKYGRMAAALSLKGGGAIIAGIPSNQFIKLIEEWGVKIKPNVITWTTCYGGGLNSESLQKIIEIIKVFKKDFNPGILVSAANSDEIVRVGRVDLNKVFENLDSIRNGSSSFASIIKKASGAVMALGFQPQQTSGLIYIPERNEFELLVGDFSEKKGIQFVKDLEVKTINLYFGEKIKFVAPGEFSQQHIDLLTTEMRPLTFLGTLMFEQNENAFFKIVNIDEIEGERGSRLYDVKIIIFPGGLKCRGYVLYSLIEKYPRNIEELIFLDSNSGLEVFRAESYRVKSGVELKEKLNLIQSQIMLNGLVEKFFKESKDRQDSSALAFVKGSETNDKTSRTLKDLVVQYNIAPNTVLDSDGLGGILLEILSDCRSGIMRLYNLIKDDNKIVEQIEHLSEDWLMLLNKQCVDSNVIKISLALKPHVVGFWGLLEDIRKNFISQPIGFYEKLFLKLLGIEILGLEFLKASSKYGSIAIKKKIYEKHRIIEPNEFTQKKLASDYIYLTERDLNELIAFPDLYRDATRTNVGFVVIRESLLKDFLWRTKNIFPLLKSLDFSWCEDNVLALINDPEISHDVLELLATYGSGAIKEKAQERLNEDVSIDTLTEP